MIVMLNNGNIADAIGDDMDIGDYVKTSRHDDYCLEIIEYGVVRAIIGASIDWEAL